MSALQRAWNERPATLGALLVALAAVVASATSLGNGFALDDVLVIEQRTRLHSLANPWELLTTAYWQLPPADTLWRPLGLLAFAAQWVVGDGSPLVFHATSVLLYVGVSLAMFAFARAILPAIGALIAGLVFAVHPVHVESVGNVVGQLELGVALTVLLAAYRYVRARRRGTLGWDDVACIVALYALGLAFKEHAILLPALLVALEWTVLREPVADASRARDAMTTLATMRAHRRILFYLLAALAVLWLLVRSDIVGGLAGDRPHVALKGLGMVARSWVMLGLVPEIARLFLWPARLYADYSPSYVSVHAVPGIVHLPGAVILVGFAATLGWCWTWARTLAFALLWIVVALSIVSNVVLPTGILLAERTLFLATVGVALAAGAVAEPLVARAAAWPRLARTAGLAMLVAILGLAAAHSAERQYAWASNDSMIAALVVDAPANFRGHYWLGDELLRRGEFVEGERALRYAMRLWPAHDGPPLALALRYHERGFCAPALALYEIAMRIDPEKPTPRFGHAGCLLALGRASHARAEALEGLRIGRAPAAMRLLMYQADSLLAATDTIRGANWWLRRR